MGQHDIEEDGEFYETAQQLKLAAKHIQKLTNGMLRFKTVRPFDKYQGPYAQCEVLGHWGRLWDMGGDAIEPEYFLETFFRPDVPENDIEGDVYSIAKLIKKQAKEKYGIGENLKGGDKMLTEKKKVPPMLARLKKKKKLKKEDILKYGTREEVEFLKEDKFTPEPGGKFPEYEAEDQPLPGTFGEMRIRLDAETLRAIFKLAKKQGLSVSDYAQGYASWDRLISEVQYWVDVATFADISQEEV